MNERVSRRAVAAGVIAAAGAAGLARSVPALASAEFQPPATPFGRQLVWALSILTGDSTGLTDDDVKAHFAPSVLAQTPTASLIASLDEASISLGPLQPIGFIDAPTETSGTLRVKTKTGETLGLFLVLSSAPENLIAILTFKPVAMGATPVASPIAAVEIPDTPVGQRLSWLIELLGGNPVSIDASHLGAYFGESFLKQVTAETLLATLNQLSIGYGPFVLGSFSEPPSNSKAKAILVGKKDARYLVTIGVGPAPDHLITGLLIRAAEITDAFGSWDEFTADWAARAEVSSYIVTEVDESARSLIAGINETAPLAIGSAFKLYVLGSLALAVQSGALAWEDILAIRDEWKSLPSGVLQNEPAGTELSLRAFAEKMISISDNTAADHLMHRLGRGNVETAMVQMGIANPVQNLPFLTTRELFALKLAADRTMVQAFLDGRGYERLGMLAAIDSLPVDLSMAMTWNAPRYIEQIEWFASANDLANAISWLLAKSNEPGLEPLRKILSLNPGVALNRSTWAFASFKGGSEVGVLTLTWFLTSASKRSFVFSAALNDTSKAIDEADAIAAATKAINHLAKSL